MKKIAIFIIIIMSSCSSVNHSKIDKINEHNIININNEKYIKVNIHNTYKTGNKSPYHVTIKNDNKDTIYIYSVVIENPSILYSKKNHIIKNNSLILNSYYKHFMKDAYCSCVDRFSYIPLKEHDSLVINIPAKLINKNINKIELIYYYYTNLKIDDKLKLAKVNNKQLKVNRLVSIIR